MASILLLFQSMVMRSLNLAAKRSLTKGFSILAVIGLASNVGVCLCPEGGDHGEPSHGSHAHLADSPSHAHSHQSPHSHHGDDPGKESSDGHTHGPNGECACPGPELGVRTECNPTLDSSAAQEMRGVAPFVVPELAPQRVSVVTPPAVGPPRADPVPLLILICRLTL